MTEIWSVKLDPDEPGLTFDSDLYKAIRLYIESDRSRMQMYTANIQSLGKSRPQPDLGQESEFRREPGFLKDVEEERGNNF